MKRTGLVWQKKTLHCTLYCRLQIHSIVFLAWTTTFWWPTITLQLARFVYITRLGRAHHCSAEWRCVFSSYLLSLPHLRGLDTSLSWGLSLSEIVHCGNLSLNLVHRRPLPHRYDPAECSSRSQALGVRWQHRNILLNPSAPQAVKLSHIPFYIPSALETLFRRVHRSPPQHSL